MEITVNTQEFLKLIEQLKKKGPKTNTKKFLNAKVDLFYLAGMAIFRVESVELAIPAKGYWGAVVSFPFPVLLSYLTAKPTNEEFKIAFLDKKIIFENFKITAAIKVI
jgi:hypothetical protein